MSQPKTLLLLVMSVFGMTAALSSCGGASGVSVDDAWARTSPAMASAGAVYMDLTAAEADRLIGVTVDPAIAATAEVHETTMASGDDMGDGHMDNGEMGDGDLAGATMMMQEVEAIELPAGEAVSLEPGGYHIMLMQLAEPLETGATFDVTLLFAEADEQVISVEVREDAP